MAENRSGAVVAAQNEARLRSYLVNLEGEKQALPTRAGKPNMNAIALAAGVDRQALYRNPHCERLIKEAAERLGLMPPEKRDAPEGTVDGRLDAKDQRIARLEHDLLKREQEAAAMRAEVHDLRRRLSRLKHIEDAIVETGRRVF